jgi:FlaA1/EpsC-like NDP-sugar epimerase
MRRKETLVLLFSDCLTLNIAWSFFYWVRVRSGWIVTNTVPDLWMPMIALCIYWFLVFFLFGLYRSWYAQSRFDELATIFKSVTFGSLVLFFAIFADDQWSSSSLHSRLLIVGYWMLVINFVGGGRMLLHTFQRRLLQAGIGLHNTLIVGWSQKAMDLFNAVKHYPALGYNVVGFVPPAAPPGIAAFEGVPILTPIDSLPSLIDRYDVRDILIALDSSEHRGLLSVIASCNGHDVSMKIMPDLYDIISGQARTNQIYGFPLIEIMPQLMQPWERAAKRAMDIIVAAFILILGLPVWLLVAVAVRLDSPGPVL